MNTGKPAGGDGAASAGPGRKLALLGESVMIQHTLFSLPFAIAAVLLETGGHPQLSDLLWIVLAAASGRNAANALNRLIDKDIDAKNPRTASRHLPVGTLKPKELKLFTAVMLALLVLSAAMLNPLCVILLPLAGILVFGYSYTKRFTWLCHFWLGLTCSAATLGAFIGISGRIEWRYLPVTAGVALWVAGFDILYALQDIDFDRKEGLKSVPARFGAKKARLIAALCHLGTLVGLLGIFLFKPYAGLGSGIALGVSAVLLAVEHVLASGGTERHIRIAAYGINEILPMIILAGVASDLYML
ncbi:MAG: 4-hydroxybenzoate octaprenyltransferase [Rectinema sp.]